MRKCGFQSGLIEGSPDGGNTNTTSIVETHPECQVLALCFWIMPWTAAGLGQ